MPPRCADTHTHDGAPTRDGDGAVWACRQSPIVVKKKKIARAADATFPSMEAGARRAPRRTRCDHAHRPPPPRHTRRTLAPSRRPSMGATRWRAGDDNRRTRGATAVCRFSRWPREGGGGTNAASLAGGGGGARARKTNKNDDVFFALTLWRGKIKKKTATPARGGSPPDPLTRAPPSRPALPRPSAHGRAWTARDGVRPP